MGRGTTIRAALARQEACVVTLRNYRRDGSMFLNRLSIRPLLDREGRVIYYLGVQYDLSAGMPAGGSGEQPSFG